MRTVLFLLLLSSPTLADLPRTLESNAFFDDIAPPQDANWDLFNGTTHLDLTIPSAPCCHQVLAFVTADNAAAQGINWSAWQAMFSTPQTLTSTIAFAGVAKQDADIVIPAHFALGKLQLWSDWKWPFFYTGDSRIFISGLASEVFPAPEPSSLMLVPACAVYIYFARPNRRRRARCPIAG